MGNSPSAKDGCCSKGGKNDELKFDIVAAAGEDEVLLPGPAKNEVKGEPCWQWAEDDTGAVPKWDPSGELNPSADEEQLGWMNFIAHHMWPYVRKAMIQKADKLVHQKLEAELAKHPEIQIQKLTFDFDPGYVPPQLKKLRIYERNQQERVAMQGDCDISWNPDEHFHFLLTISGRAKRFPIRAQNIGASAMSMQGTLACLLAPLLPYEPCVSTGQGFFLDTPEVNITLTGMKGLGPIGTLLTGMIEGIINDTLADSFILPNRFVQNIEQNLPLEKRINMKSPLPLAVLRVEVLEGRNLPAADISLVTGKRSSDFFVTVKIGHDRIRTSTVPDSVDPVWTDPPGHLFVYNVDQLVRINVCDDDVMSTDDCLGAVLGYNVFGLCQECAGPSNPDGAWLDVIDANGAKAGRIRVRATFFDVGDIVETGNPPLASYCDLPEGSEPAYLVTVRLLGLDGPDNEDLTNTRVFCEIAGDEPVPNVQEHHANRLMGALEGAAHFAKTKAHLPHMFDFGQREGGIPLKQKSGHALLWGSTQISVDESHKTVVTPCAMRAMESLYVEEGWEISDIAETFGIDEKTVTTAVFMRGNFEVIWGEAVHFLQTSSSFKKLKLSVQAPVANRVRGADESGTIGCFEVDLPPDPTSGYWASRVRKNLLQPKAKPSKEEEPAAEAVGEDGKFKASAKSSSKSKMARFTGMLKRSDSGGEVTSADAATGDGTKESDEVQPVVLECVVEMRSLIPCDCAKEASQTLRDTSTLVEATKVAGVKFTLA